NKIGARAMKRFAIIFTLLLIMLIPAGSALAAPLFDIVVEEGEVLEEDITVFGDELVVEEGARIEGEVTVGGGTAEMSGEVDGNITVFGGDVVLSGQVTGNVTTMGGSVTLAETAEVLGECVIFGGHLEDNNSRMSCARAGLPERLPPFGPGAIMPEMPGAG